MDESFSRKGGIIVLILIRSSYAMKNALDWNEILYWYEIFIEGNDSFNLIRKVIYHHFSNISSRMKVSVSPS
jgi:hypothetical protein